MIESIFIIFAIVMSLLAFAKIRHDFGFSKVANKKEKGVESKK